MKAYETTKTLTFADESQILVDTGVINPISQTNPLHEVKQDETLLSIAFKYYGNHQDWVNIYLANNLFDPFDLELGQRLIIPNN